MNYGIHSIKKNSKISNKNKNLLRFISLFPLLKPIRPTTQNACKKFIERLIRSKQSRKQVQNL